MHLTLRSGTGSSGGGKKKENTINKACRQEVSVFHSSSYSASCLLSVRFGSTLVFISSSYVVHLFNISVGRAIPRSLPPSLSDI
jgi:hypothetical protein